MKKNFVLITTLIFFLAISSAVMAQNEDGWENNFQKEFANLDYLNQKSWGTEIENKAEVIQEGDNNSASIRQNGSGNNALTVQEGNFNQALITQIGDSNSAIINQAGSNNQAVIIQN